MDKHRGGTRLQHRYAQLIEISKTMQLELLRYKMPKAVVNFISFGGLQYRCAACLLVGRSIRKGQQIWPDQLVVLLEEKGTDA